MIPGLSAHMPEVVVYADQMEPMWRPTSRSQSHRLSMQLEVEWVARIIHQAKKPVMTIKPMAAGR